ncbi:MAG TPA: DegT/DnrJ/EryC1/StrS family aminotransferase [Gaiellaceae bacterium]
MSNTAPESTVPSASSGGDGAGLRPAGADAGERRESISTRRVALSAPWIDDRDEELVLETLRSGQLSLGPRGPRFEELLAEAVGARYCAAVSSGTAGLHLCMRLAGIEPGDEVITSPYSFVASANCAIYEGAKPVFADIDPLTYNLDPDAVAAAVTSRTKAIVAVDIFGYPCELDPLLALCSHYGLRLVEDACEAFGARYKGRPLGSHGHPAVFAFYPNKQVTTGEGGAVTTNDEDEYGLLVSLRNQGRLDTRSWLMHGRLGYNYRLDDISAALGIGQLEKLDRVLEARRAVAQRYGELLADVDVEKPLPDDDEHERSWFVYVVKLPADVDRDGVIGRLAEHGVASAPYLPSIHLQDYMRERYGFREGMLPVSEDCSRRTLALPFHARLDPADQEYVVDALRTALQ